MLAPDMSALIGADPDRLDTASRQLTRLAAQLSESAARLDRLARGAANGPSVGHDVVRVLARDLDSSAAALRSDAVLMQRRSAGQRKSSAVTTNAPSKSKTRRPDILDRNGDPLYEKFRDTYFSFGFGPPHGERTIQKTGAVDPRDSRLYFARFFIPEDAVTVMGVGGRGDGRGYSTQPDGTPYTKDDGTPLTEPDGTPRIVRSKIAFVWRPLDGAVSYTSYDSRELDGTPSAALKLTEDSFKVLKAEPGAVTFRFAAQNSLHPYTTPSIDGTYTFVVSPDAQGEPAGVSFSGAGDNYPSLEVGYVDRNGCVVIIGTAKRGTLFDLAWPNDDRKVNFVLTPGK